MTERDPRRRFNTAERVALYLAADGRCTRCGRELEPGWHADHRDPHSRGGPTDVINGQALCPTCNLTKGNHHMSQDSGLRDWQKAAIRRFDVQNKRDFLVCATPGAGKTRLALTLAARALSERSAERVVIVVPTDHLRGQWVEEAADMDMGLDLMPVEPGMDAAAWDKPGYVGWVMTYAQCCGLSADLLRIKTSAPTFALLDEVHHAGDKRAWGEGVRSALEFAVRRVALTGTPWRQDKTSPIPFVEYEPSTNKVKVDSSYEYGQAALDRVCRRIEFHAYDGQARWVDCGSVQTKQLVDVVDDEDVSAALAAVLDPKKEWMPAVVDAAIEALDEIRRDVPDAGGLIVCDWKWQVDEYEALLTARTGERPTVVVSENAPKDDQRIAEFIKGRSRWLIAIRMVSEGVDIPRLAVGVYATRVKTPLFFRQVVGRLVRTRPDEDVNAKLFIPAVEAFTSHAREIEEELRHQLEAEKERMEKEEQEARDGQRVLDLREPLSASDAAFAASIFGGRETSPEVFAEAEDWCRERGIPLQYAPNVVPDIVAAKRSEPIAQVTVTPTAPKKSRARLERGLRDEVNALVGKIAHRAGRDKKDINADILRAGFPARAQCSVEQLEQMRDQLARWLGEM